MRVPPVNQPDLTLKLRHDLTWSNGERLTAGDVRHSLRLARKHEKGLTEVLADPLQEADPFELPLSFRRGMLDPWDALRIPLVPRQFRGQDLESLTDAEFAKHPTGSGPFLLSVVDKDSLTFQANPYFHPAPPYQEIHWKRWQEGDKPGVLWDVPADAVGALKKRGYQLRTISPPRVWHLALNLQDPALASLDVRLALAYGIDREKILDKHFRFGQKLHAAANGPFIPGSSAQAQAPRVPAHLHQAELSRNYAKKAGQEVKSARWKLILFNSDPHQLAAGETLAKQMMATMETASIACTIDVEALGAFAYAAALEKGAYDLALTSIEHGEELLPLAGIAQIDPRLQEIFSQILRYRQFSQVKERLHDFHAALLERMPIIPLWSLQVPVAIQPGLPVPFLPNLGP